MLLNVYLSFLQFLHPFICVDKLHIALSWPSFARHSAIYLSLNSLSSPVLGLPAKCAVLSASSPFCIGTSKLLFFAFNIGLDPPLLHFHNRNAIPANAAANKTAKIEMTGIATLLGIEASVFTSAFRPLPLLSNIPFPNAPLPYLPSSIGQVGTNISEVRVGHFGFSVLLSSSSHSILKGG